MILHSRFLHKNEEMKEKCERYEYQTFFLMIVALLSQFHQCCYCYPIRFHSVTIYFFMFKYI